MKSPRPPACLSFCFMSTLYGIQTVQNIINTSQIFSRFAQDVLETSQLTQWDRVKIEEKEWIYILLLGKIIFLKEFCVFIMHIRLNLSFLSGELQPVFRFSSIFIFPNYVNILKDDLTFLNIFTGGPKKNENGFVFNSSGQKEAKYC